MLEICLQRFQAHPGIDGILLVCPAEHLSRAEKIVSAGSCAKVLKILAGGRTRQGSSAIGVIAAPERVENVLLHDAARALVPEAVITRVLESLADSRAVIPVLRAGDTTIHVDDEGTVTDVLDRVELRSVQTPQGFKLETIRQAHEMASQEGITEASDDCSLVLRYKLAPVVTVEGDISNIKITYPEDLVTAEAWIRVRGFKKDSNSKS